MTYENFLLSKIRVAEKTGIDVSIDSLHPDSRPHQKSIAKWALKLGKALIAPDCGTGKTNISIDVLTALQREFSGKCLVVTELGAHDTYCSTDPEVGEGARMGIPIMFARTTNELLELPTNIVCTNYESVRAGKVDFKKFTAVWLDEGNYIKNMASETTEALRQQLKKVQYKYIASATPSPNEVLELVNYAHVLDIADRGQILTQFFQRNSTKAGELTLHPQHEADFWLWVYSWMVAIEKPSDLGFSDEDYILPELKIEWHEVKLNKHIEAGIEKDGQKKMFLDTGNSLPDNAKIKKASIHERLAAAMELINSNAGDSWIIWHHLEDERRAIEKVFKNRDYKSLYGSLNADAREQIIIDFTKGSLQYLGTKPELSGVGCNFQKHCHKAVVLGINNDFNLLYQPIKRIHRPYNDGHACEIHIFYTPEEYSIVQNLKRKWRQHDEQRTWLRGLVRKYGLDHSKMIEERRRTFKVGRKVFKGENFTLVNTDAVFEYRDQIPDGFFQLYNTSFPFGNHYEYTNYYNDFGHNSTNRNYIKQLDYLIPEMFRALEPGRICAVHLKNRIHYGSVTGLGFSIFHRFTHLVCEAMEKHGFYTMGFHFIPTDVVAENNQTYRLTKGEMLKDSTKMGAGIPEEIWVFRKPPTSNANAYADFPVTHDEVDYSLAAWQVDADGFWSSSGNRLLTPFEMKSWGLKKIRRWWDMFNKEHIYDYEQHVQLLQDLDHASKLSRTFTTLPFQSNTDWIWSNVNRMHGLNMEQSRRKERNHICPQPTDEAARIIELYSNEGDMVGDPFGGLGTTGVEAIKKGRKTYITELNEEYARCSHIYLKEAELKRNTPTLFDFVNQEKAEFDYAIAE